MTLYKITLTSNIRDLPDKVEYLRSSSRKRLETMYNQCFNIRGSEYFGYDHFHIRPMKISHFPEIMSVKI